MYSWGYSPWFLVVCAFPAGIFADKIGKKRILSIGVLIAAIGLSIGAFTTEIMLIYIAMGLTGLGFGVIVVLNFALTADLLPKGKEGKFMGLGNIFYAAPQMTNLLHSSVFSSVYLIIIIKLFFMLHQYH